MIATGMVLALLACAGDSSGITEPEGKSSSIRLTPSSDTVSVGDTARLTAVDGLNVPLHANSLTWSSTNPGVATVDQGRVTAHSAGRVTITASNPGTKSASSEVVVYEPGKVPAFPGAQGYGAMALSSCDRTRPRTLRVTNLADDGPGSLRDAIRRVPGGVLTVIVFDVAGYIDLLSRIDLTQNCLYIAGQTAPGGGIAIRATGITGIFFRHDVHDVVIRHLVMRSGYGGDNLGNININIGSGRNIVLDHLSLGWTTDKLLNITKYDATFSKPISGVTVQRSLFHEVLAYHPTAVQISGEKKDGATEWTNIKDISLHNNLFAHNHHRNPNVTTYGTQLVNNVIYNWTQGAVQSTRESRLDVIANYFKTGPADDPDHRWEITWDCESGGELYFPSLHVEGNVGPHNQDPSADNWIGPSRMTACYYKTGSEVGEALPEDFRRSNALSIPEFPVRVLPAPEAYESVLADVGANTWLACDGSVMEREDPVDRRIRAEVRNGDGPARPLATEVEAGGFPQIAGGEACADSDGDGMPDDFESRFGLDPESATDAALDSNANGYSNLEEYLNGQKPTT